MDTKKRKRKQVLKFVPDVTIADKIKQYFDKGLTAEFTSRMDGTANIKTCIKYFRYWREEVTTRNMQEISERQRQVRYHFLGVYDQIIYDTLAQKGKFIKAMKEDEKYHENLNKQLLEEQVHIKELLPYKPDEFLEIMFLRINRFYSDLLMAKGALESAPFIDEETTEATIAEMQKQLETITKEQKKE